MYNNSSQQFQDFKSRHRLEHHPITYRLIIQTPHTIISAQNFCSNHAVDIPIGFS